MKLGSLFDGIGGFPLAASKYGIEAVWASEIEAWPIKVTQKHFPNMKHLGDITQINGAEIEPVDIITFGSPCQDLSVAGKRAGLEGERSGLFSEAIRIIKEMRCATDDKYPRFAVWENVPGAFSSNKGEDFRAVLEEITEAEIPMPRSGKWATAGMVRTERVDIAWRTLDAQYWGVPQRRRRIFLVADFGGQSAGEILFVEEGLSGHFAKSRQAREEAAATVGNGVKTAIPINTQIATRHNKLGRGTGFGIGEDGDPSFTLQEAHSHAVCCKYVATASYWDGGQISDCLDCSMLAKGQMMPEKRRFPAVLEPIPIHDQATRFRGKRGDRQDGKGHGLDIGNPGDPMNTLGTSDRHAVAYGVDCRNLYENNELSATIQAKPNGGQSLNYINPVRQGYAVRRLTPTEALRLQGFPDSWLDIDGASDTAKYKAIGNSVAIVCVDFIMAGIAEVLLCG